MRQDYNYLPWISDQALEEAVLKVYLAMKNALADTTMSDLQSQIIDPFALVLETSATNLSVEQWIQAEAQRQAQKSWMNQVGYFHQEILGAVDGWTDLLAGDDSEIDFKKDDDSIYAEIKNKHNTMNSSSEKETRHKLERLVEAKPLATAYLVQIIRIRKHPYDELWTLKGFETHPRIRKISGELFYAKVTGYETALHDLYHTIPDVMKKIVEEHEELSLGKTSAMTELVEQSPNETNNEFLRFFIDFAYRNYNKLASDD
ncbi:MAG: Eco47II family restriction endonuclease [Chloroflexota bacterium]